MTECAGCGDCCDPVHLVHGPADIDNIIATGKFKGTKLAQRTIGWLAELELVRKVWNGRRMNYEYRCRRFDPQKRQCTSYGMRPNTCSGYPWYNSGPERGDTTMGGRCTFLADAGYKMLPIVDTR